MNKFIAFLLLFSSTSFAQTVKTCDTAIVAQYTDGSTEITGEHTKQDSIVYDNGRQFDVIFGGYKFSSPRLSPVAKGVVAANSKDPSGTLRFIKRDGTYQLTDDGIEFTIFFNCVTNKGS